MIKLILLILFTMNTNDNCMDNIEFEKLLGESILVFEKAIGDDFKKNPIRDSYSVKDWNMIKTFHGMSYNLLSVDKDEKDKIKSIYINFNSIISRDFFDSLNWQYGKPNSILIMANRTLEGEHIEKDENGKNKVSARKYSLDLKEGSFEDKPLYIIWKKYDYEIKALLIHKQGRSKIMFNRVD